ncbi:MAG: response regulator [Elusimicrobia bacterium]|nr:response regulator [Elusimicrobiota bacterium]
MARILIADDNPQNAYMLECALKGVGHEVVSACDGAAALRAALAEPPDLLITDILMPVMDGYELCRRWKAHDRLKKVPFIFYTATYTDPKDEQFGLSLGADRFVVKPAEVEALQELVAEVLEEASLGKPGFPAQPRADESEALRRHAEVMFRKLEHKVKELEAANRAKDDFLAIVSHELRTPLTSILGWGWLLRYGGLSEPERGRALDIILRSMQDQRRIVEDLIDMSSISRGQLGMAREAVELGAVLESVCESLSEEAGRRGIRLERELQGPVRVLGDAGRLRQVFANLVHNGLKFSPDGNSVRMTLRREGGEAVVEVQDQGEGIAPGLMPRIFEPFRQGEEALIRRHGGLGLGLAIVKNLVERHGGRVCAASAGEGSGATFTVRLPAPALQDAPEPAAEPAPAPGAGGLEGLSVLVVEDEPDALRMLQQVLESRGVRVRTAADAESAWSSLQQETPDLILCDIALPGEDGCSLLRRVRSRGGAPGAVPAAALSALAREADRSRALEAGFQSYLTKPIEPPQILEAVRALARRLSGGSGPGTPGRTSAPGTGP